MNVKFYCPNFDSIKWKIDFSPSISYNMIQNRDRMSGNEKGANKKKMCHAKNSAFEWGFHFGTHQQIRNYHICSVWKSIPNIHCHSSANVHTRRIQLIRMPLKMDAVKCLLSARHSWLSPTLLNALQRACQIERLNVGFSDAHHCHRTHTLAVWKFARYGSRVMWLCALSMDLDLAKATCITWIGRMF